MLSGAEGGEAARRHAVELLGRSADPPAGAPSVDVRRGGWGDEGDDAEDDAGVGQADAGLAAVRICDRASRPRPTAIGPRITPNATRPASASSSDATALPLRSNNQRPSCPIGHGPSLSHAVVRYAEIPSFVSPRRAHTEVPHMPKHIFVTGGVASSLGKGLTASSLGRLLKLRGPAGHAAEARPVHQRRPGHDEPVRARRGVRHRRRRRDRPRPRPLRALHRREPVAGLQRHDRLDLPVGAGRRAPRRLPRQDGPGHPPHHRRDQAAHPPPRHRRRRRRDHRGRRHRRRHRDPPVPRGDPPVPQGGRPRQRLLRPRHARAVHRPVGRAEDEADPALGHRAAQPRHPARPHRVPQRGAAERRPQGQDLQPVRRRQPRRRQRRRRPQHLRAPADPPRRGPRRGGVRGAAHGDAARAARPRAVGAGRRAGRGRHASRCASA